MRTSLFILAILSLCFLSSLNGNAQTSPISAISVEGAGITEGSMTTIEEGFSASLTKVTDMSNSINGNTYTVSPTVTINKAASQPDPTTGTPIRFTVVFSEDVNGFDASDISFGGSTSPGTLVATVSGSGSTYTVAINGMTGAGEVVATVIAGAATNISGEESLASTSTDNIVQLLVFAHDFIVTKTAMSPYVAAGGVITYTISVFRNPAIPGPFLQNVTLTDVLPTGTIFLNIQHLSSNVPSTPFLLLPANNNGTLMLLFPIFNPGNFYTFLLRAAVPANMTGSISNTATVGGPIGDVNPVNNSATAIVQVMEPPTITCPGNIVTNSDLGTCNSTISFTGSNEIIATGLPAPKFSYSINSQSGIITVSDLTSIPSSLDFSVGVSTVTVTATNGGGTASCSFTVTVVDDQPPVINCQPDITANAATGACSALVEYSLTVTDNCFPAGRPLTVVTSAGLVATATGSGPIILRQTKEYPVGTTTVIATATDASGNTATCSFNVTVIDIENPVITTCPSPVTVSCVSEVPAVNIAGVTATDNCGTATITHASDVISNQTCANKYTITRTYKATDASGNTATCTQTITVDDITAPTITGLSPSKQILAPPNHKMVDVILNYTVNDNCVSTPNVTVSITSNEPVNGTGDGDTDPDWEVIDDHRIRLRAERAGNGTGRIYTITVTVNDGCNAAVSATTDVRVTHNITSPVSGNSFKVGSTVAFTGEFWDVPTNKHTAKWLIDGVSVNGIVTEPAGVKNGKVTGSYKFNTPGVYKLQMNVTDQKGITTYANMNGDLEAIVVIYDPNGGYTYGGGYYNSPAGALVSNPSSTGKASYGFAMNYFKNSTNPKGETQFEFKVGEFEFNALNFDYLVINNSMSQFKGTGKIIGGQSGIGFTMTVVDGQLDGTGIDKIRMKIYNKNNGRIIYDNQPGAGDAALPIQAVGANSTIVISGVSSSLTQSNSKNQTSAMEVKEKSITGFNVLAYPNPSKNSFSITVQADTKEKILMQVIDMHGRIIESRNVTARSVVKFGEQYRPGTYFVRLVEGKQHKELKLVKITD